MGEWEECIAPEEPADVAEDEAEEHVEMNGDSTTLEGLVGAEYDDRDEEWDQGDHVADISENQDSPTIENMVLIGIKYKVNPGKSAL